MRCALLMGLLLAAGVAAAREPTMNAGELAHALDRVAQTGRVLYVAAHPDDENTRLLAYLASGRHLQVAYLSMTRGGGGQNLIGAEQGELLDVIRTQELLAARGLDGARQYFTRVRDFGYSKSAAETLRIWDHEEALADVVRVIRTFQPDVVITRFDENPPNHGHHTASAILAREAVAAAADPQRFPGLPAWKVERLLHNVPTWPGRPPPPPEALSLDVGGWDARLGLSYGELAARSRSQHRSQGFGVTGERGPIVERFLPVAGSRPVRDVLDGVDVTWNRYGARASPLVKALAEARAALDRDHPERAVPPLLRARDALAALPDDARVRDARAALEELAAAASGLFVRATAPRPVATPGSRVQVDVEIVARGPVPVKVLRVLVPGAAGEAPGVELAGNAKQVIPLQATLPPEAKVTAPSFLASTPEPGRFQVDSQVGVAPLGPAALHATVALQLAGRPLELQVPVVHSFNDRVYGERVRDLVVVPPATVTPVRGAVMVRTGKAATAVLRVRAGQDGVEGVVQLELPPGFRAEPASIPVKLAAAGDEVLVNFEVRASPGAAVGTARPVFTSAGRSWSWREDPIDHPHIPVQVVLQPASLRVAPLDAKVPEGLVGYIEGSGDTVADDLAHVGLRVEKLDDEALRAGDLSRYRAIVVGIRAYNVRPALRSAHERLMRYVEAGGTVVAQYNTSSSWDPLRSPVGPFPLEIGRGRVTDETAEMVLADPESPLLRTPNRITAADFDGWVQERGIYFASTWDPRYRPLLRVADPGEDAQEGSTLVATHGKGRHVYTGLVFFRQLPAGVPGAYRLFLNLLAR